MVCSFKKCNGCPARATIRVTESVDDESGEKKTEYSLVEVSHPQHHLTHLPDPINIIADQILVKMKEGAERDLLTPVGKLLLRKYFTFL